MSYAQTYTVIYNFTGGYYDGSLPYATLTLDRAGNLYGTAFSGGQFANGTVFRMMHQEGAGWVFSTLNIFPGAYYGSGPYGPVVFGPDGALYGTTYRGGNTACAGGQGCGTVFLLQPPPSVCHSTLCLWNEVVLYPFSGGDGNGNPEGPLTFDSSGDIYGTTRNGYNGSTCGGTGCGSVYELAWSGSFYIPSVLYAFTGSNDQGLPDSGVIFDSSGNLYGTTQGCFGTGDGTVFKLTALGSSWSYSTLFEFPGGIGDCPVAGLLMSSNGNLYGATANGSGAAFEGTLSGGSYTFSLMAKLGSENGQSCGPQSSLIMDSAGNFYGTTYCDGAHGLGSVFKISPAGSGWTVTNLHDFAGDDDGRYPVGGVVMDSSGHLYGTTSEGGTYGNGTVWEITP